MILYFTKVIDIFASAKCCVSMANINMRVWSLADDPKMSLRMIVKSWHHNEIVRRFIDYMHDICMLYLCPEAAMYLYIRSNINKYRQKKWKKQHRI